MNHCLQLLSLAIAFCNPVGCAATDCVPPIYDCPPTCENLPGYYAVIGYGAEKENQTDAMKAAGVSKLIPSREVFTYASPYGTILILHFEVECNDLSKFLFPTLTFNDPYTGSGYELTKYSSLAEKKGVDFKKIVPCDKMNTYTFQKSPVMSSDGKWLPGAFSGTISLAYNMSGSLFEHRTEKELYFSVFFVRPLFEGDDRSYVYPIRDSSTAYLRTEENGDSNSSNNK